MMRGVNLGPPDALPPGLLEGVDMSAVLNIRVSQQKVGISGGLVLSATRCCEHCGALRMSLLFPVS